MNDYDLFFKSVRDAFSAPISVVSILFFLFILVMIWLLIRLIIYLYNRYQNTQIILNPALQLPKLIKRKSSVFNPAQKKVVYDIITEFKRFEIIAEAIPESVLERFSEYFFERQNRLRISPALSNKLISKMYPIVTGQIVEMELIIDNKLTIIPRNVLQMNERAIVVQSIDDLTIVIQKGMPITICYSLKNHFLTGESQVDNILTNNRLVLAYPKNLQVTNERRFSRAPLDKINGSLVPVQSKEEAAIVAEIKDISLEGARVRANTMLKKNQVYRLSFADNKQERPFGFQNFECVVSQSFIIQQGLYEYGLSFVYLGLDKRAKLTEYIQTLVKRLKPL